VKNGMAWTWVVGSMPGAGDVAMQVPGGLLSSPKMPDEFPARRLTLFRVSPEEGGTAVRLVPSLLSKLGAAPDEVRVRASSVAWWAPATEDCAGKLDAFWTPAATVEVPGPAVAAAVLRGPGAR